MVVFLEREPHHNIKTSLHLPGGCGLGLPEDRVEVFSVFATPSVGSSSAGSDLSTSDVFPASPLSSESLESHSSVDEDEDEDEDGLGDLDDATAP